MCQQEISLTPKLWNWTICLLPTVPIFYPNFISHSWLLFHCIFIYLLYCGFGIYSFTWLCQPSSTGELPQIPAALSSQLGSTPCLSYHLFQVVHNLWPFCHRSTCTCSHSRARAELLHRSQQIKSSRHQRAQVCFEWKGMEMKISAFPTVSV